MLSNIIKILKFYITQKSTFLSLMWFYRIFIKKSNARLIKTISKFKIGNKLLVDFINDKSLVIDIGSHGGSWAFFLSKLVKQGQVICFEALPVYAHALKKVVFLSGTNNIVVHNYAVSHKSENVFITWLDIKKNRLTGMTRISTKTDQSYQKLKVNGISLDKFFLNSSIGNKHISFIKIDIEGAELFALKGGINTINKHKPIILMEVCIRHIKNFNYNVKDIYDFFHKIDYVPIMAIHSSENFVEKSKIDPDFNDDIVFVHKTILGKTNA